MRKITEQISRAFLAGDTQVISNTETDGTCVWLHGNKIAEKVTESRIRVTLAGWNTPTTRERVNGILETFGIPARFSQKNFEAVLTVAGHSAPVPDDEWQNFNF